MDAYELFRKLSTGVKFDKKRFQIDAEKFQVFSKNKILYLKIYIYILIF